jgi:uncharacterized protein involved in high-affinity Fe2+ transport
MKSVCPRSLAALIMAIGVLCFAAGAARAGNLPAGEPLEHAGLRVSALYLQAVETEAPMTEMPHAGHHHDDSSHDEHQGEHQSGHHGKHHGDGAMHGAGDIHMEARIHALANNPYGFREGDWVPYLGVTYRITKKGGAWTSSGVLHPMMANDGPHYGANVALDGPGAYELTLTVNPPAPHAFMRHTDDETGATNWWQPFNYRGGFKFIGTGKKGGY